MVGTASIEKSEILHNLLVKAKIPHSVLNAKNHEKEAEIIAKAGEKGAVTIATNMAGRGVDIRINDEICSLGGLYIIGTERHESRRIDNQLRGRSGRQGDPGMSRFFLSLEDNLLRIFGSGKIKTIMDKLGIEDGEKIESRLVTRAVENAQKKVESLHFEARKHILEYDDVANEQRKTIYKYRNELLDPEFDLHDKIISNRKDFVADLMAQSGIYAGELSEEFDLDKLVKIVYENSGTEVEKSNLEQKNYDEVLEIVAQTLEQDYEEKIKVAGDERQRIEKVLYLQVVDRAWREHLYQMDTLKAGIGLRGYNQRDLLTEYKKESYNLFVELVGRLKSESVRTLQVVRFTFEEAQELHDPEQPSSDQDFKKVGRNDPCPCGSGKKYKECHGKSGPKKGAFA